MLEYDQRFVGVVRCLRCVTPLLFLLGDPRLLVGIEQSARGYLVLIDLFLDS